MKLYDFFGPNPRVVQMFLLEKGLEIERISVNALAGENRADAFKKKNPAGTVPALELDDGTVLAESTVICEYLEELHPTPRLIGTDALSRAIVRMWTRRITLMVNEPITYGFRFGEGLPLFQNRVRCLPEASEGFKAIASDGIAWIEEQMKPNVYIAGPAFSMADILLYCFLDFAEKVGQKIDSKNSKVHAWYQRIGARPSATATNYSF